MMPLQIHMIGLNNMNVDYILSLIEQYGPLIIFICLFLGVVGIPAPEETLVVIIGILIHQHALPAISSISSAFLGVFCGFLFSYIVGRYAGTPLLYKITHFLRLSDVKVRAFQEKYEANYKRAILIGLYIPGARQINPYLAGISQISFIEYLIVSLIGTTIWVVPFMSIGFFTANVVTIKYEFLPLIGVCIGFIFILYFIIKRKSRKKR